MFRNSSIKRTLIAAVAFILLCFICLTGATLALFSDSGSIGVVATSGTVKVDIVDTSEKENSLVGKPLQFMTTADSRDLLFEPGATFRTQGFKVKNSGSIPINFRLSVSESAEVDMHEFNRAFEVWISTDPKNPAAATKLTEYICRLEAGDSSTDTYYLFIKMKEAVGNEFQGKTYSGIGVTVYAVQGNVNVEE